MATRTILIVEDDPALQDNLHAYLTSQNFRVLQAGDVDTALSIIKKDIPDAILLDLLLPGKHGTVLLQTMQQEGKRIPTIVITNTDSAGRREQCMQLGARDFIIKSNTSLQEILRLILKYCENKGEAKAEG